MRDIAISIHNTRTEIFYAPEDLLNMIDVMTSYIDPAFEGLTSSVDQYNDLDRDHAWDGKHHFLRRPKTKPPWINTGLRDIVVECCQRMGFTYQVHDLRVAPEEDVPHYFEALPLWPHQEEAVTSVLRNPDGVIVMPPRSGKTLTLLEAFRRRNQPTLWIAPTSSIVDQTVERALEWFHERDVQKLTTNPTPDQYNAMLGIVTAAAASKLPQEYMDTRAMLVGDELHHFLANNAWGSGLIKKTAHIYYRYGMTGTFFRSNGDDLAMHAFLSRKLYTVATTELMDKGYLVPTYVAFVKIEAPTVRRKHGNRKFHGEGGIGYEGIHTHEYRNNVVADTVAYLHGLGRTVLVLVGTKVQGRILEKLIRERIPPASRHTEFEAAEFVSTDRKSVNRRILRAFTEGQEVRVLIGTSLIGEGIDLPSADALVYARGEKAPVSLVQGWFRVCTASPGKEFGLIVDFADTHHRTLEAHSRDRWNLASQEPIFRLSYLENPHDLKKWCEG